MVMELKHGQMVNNLKETGTGVKCTETESYLLEI